MSVTAAIEGDMARIEGGMASIQECLCGDPAGKIDRSLPSLGSAATDLFSFVSGARRRLAHESAHFPAPRTLPDGFGESTARWRRLARPSVFMRSESF